MKTKTKVKKLDKLSVGVNIPTISTHGASTSEYTAPGREVKIFSFDGDFGRVDINLLRDKVNEIINFLNK